MAERPKAIVIKPKEMHCSDCVFGHQIIAGVVGGNVADDGRETGWMLMRTIPVGQTRNCFSRFQRIIGIAGEKFIYPDEDDTCINSKKFKPKEAPNIVY